jgi:hypothetical protein
MSHMLRRKHRSRERVKTVPALLVDKAGAIFDPETCRQDLLLQPILTAAGLFALKPGVRRDSLKKIA